MKERRDIPLSVVVLVFGGILALAAAFFALNLAVSPYAGAVAAGLAVIVLFSVTGFLFWVVRALENSEERLRVIVESAHDGIITTDESGYIERINTSTVSMFGYRPGKLVGTHASVLLPSAYGERGEDEGFLAYLERENIGELGIPHEVFGLRQNGQIFPMDMSVTHAYVGEEEVFTIMVRDVTERAAAQQALREARDALELRVQDRTLELEASNLQLESEVEQRKALIEELQQALSEVKALSGLLPICASCKNVRDDQGYWSQIEVYIRDHSEAEFSHGICPDCMQKLYPELNGSLPES